MCNRTVGSPIIACPLGDVRSSEQNDSDHSDCAIEILSISDQRDFDDDADEYKDSQMEIYVKNLNEPLCIKYKTTACTMQVTLWIEYDPANSIHSTFYGSYEGNGVIGSRVAVLLESENKEAGLHQVFWDGRDKTDDHRILLEGTYTVRIQGLHEITLTDQTTIKIPLAPSCNYGIHYHKRRHLVTTKKEVEHASNKQRQLFDRTSFDSESRVDFPAADSWYQMCTSAVTATATHSNPFSLFLYSEESTSGNRARYSRDKSSRIGLFNSDNDVEGRDIVLLDDSSDALRDVFLMVLAGCRSGNDIFGIQDRLILLSRSFNPGRVDGDFGDKTREALKEWQQWENIEPPYEGVANTATCIALNIDTNLEGDDLTTAIQEKLKLFSRRYFPGKRDGKWGRKTETALTNYQEDHSPPLDINSLPDRKTLRHLSIGDSEGMTDLNMVEGFLRRGCNIALGFKASVSFRAAEKWHMHFWDNLAAGAGIDHAATDAVIMCGRRHHVELDYTLKTRDGIDKNETLHPARYGKDMDI